MSSEKPTSPANRSKRIIKLTAFAALSCILAYAVISTGLAWLYAYFLTHPACFSNPSPIPGLPEPEEHWLKTSDGLSLRAWYYPGENGAAIIALDGMGGALGENLPPVEFLIRAGFGVLQIDSRACARPSSAVTLGAKEAFDAEAGLMFLQSRPEVEIIGIFGFSMGAAAAVRSAARQVDIAAVVAEGGYFNLGEDFVEPDSRLGLPHQVFLYSIAGAYWLFSGVNPWEVSPIEDLPAISPRPLLLIYGEREADSGRALAQYAVAREPKTLWIVPGGAHGSNYAASPGEYRRRVIEFFKKELLESDY